MLAKSIDVILNRKLPQLPKIYTVKLMSQSSIINNKL